MQERIMLTELQACTNLRRKKLSSAWKSTPRTCKLALSILRARSRRASWRRRYRLSPCPLLALSDRSTGGDAMLQEQR
eukprot:758704-Hanusia_phi.AAC.3